MGFLPKIIYKTMCVYIFRYVCGGVSIHTLIIICKGSVTQKLRIYGPTYYSKDWEPLETPGNCDSCISNSGCLILHCTHSRHSILCWIELKSKYFLKATNLRPRKIEGIKSGNPSKTSLKRLRPSCLRIVNRTNRKENKESKHKLHPHGKWFFRAVQIWMSRDSWIRKLYQLC